MSDSSETTKKEAKTTEFIGFMSGDYECFCLSKIPFEEWSKLEVNRKFESCSTFDPMLLYPSYFFPKNCNEGKWKFTIIVKAERVTE